MTRINILYMFYIRYELLEIFRYNLVKNKFMRIYKTNFMSLQSLRLLTSFMCMWHYSGAYYVTQNYSLSWFVWSRILLTFLNWRGLYGGGVLVGIPGVPYNRSLLLIIDTATIQHFRKSINSCSVPFKLHQWLCDLLRSVLILWPKSVIVFLSDLITIGFN